MSRRSRAPRSLTAQRSSRSRRISSTRSTHSLTVVCLSSVAEGAVTAPPAAWFVTSTENTTSSTTIGMASAPVQREILIEELQRLDHHRVPRGVEVGHRPFGGIGVDQVPGEQRRVIVVQQLDVHVLRLDALVLDTLPDPVEHRRLQQQAPLEHQLRILRPRRILLDEPVLPTLGDLLRAHLDRQAAHLGEAGVVVVRRQAEDLHLEVERDGWIVVGHQSFWTSKPSWAISIDSIATSLPEALSCGPSTFTGKALWTFHTITGWCSSLSRLITRSRRSTLLSLTVLSHLKKSLSLLITPRFMVTLLNLRRPGILIDEYSGNEPSRYSIAWFSWVRPETSENPTRVPPHSTVKWNTGSGYCAGMVVAPYKSVVRRSGACARSAG